VSHDFAEAVSDFAVGTPPIVAARSGDSIFVYDGRAWKKLPDLDPPRAELKYRLFFGRDNQPRLMGYEPGTAPRSFYRRFKGGRFQPEPSELGPLGSANGPLYGVLGFADPEVVCKPREVCLVKRLSGWNRVPAHDAPVPIFLGHGDAWAFVDHTLQHLESKGFREFSPPQHFERPSALWSDEHDLPWVLDEGALLRAAKDSGWTRLEVPLAASRALAGTSSREVWVAGESGAAVFDGSRFACIRELSAAFSGITRAGDDFWFWGANGAFRLRRTTSR
jgi:hypothetical protein